jgi:hypothetical protein
MVGLVVGSGPASVKAFRFASVPAGRPWWAGLDPGSAAGGWLGVSAGPDLGGPPGGGGAVALGFAGGAKGAEGGVDAGAGQVAPEEVPELGTSEPSGATHSLPFVGVVTD